MHLVGPIILVDTYYFTKHELNHYDFKGSETSKNCTCLYFYPCYTE
jgi:hypothetical protein